MTTQSDEGRGTKPAFRAGFVPRLLRSQSRALVGPRSCLIVFVFSLLTGCHSNGNRDLLERELRHREWELRDAREALDQCRAENDCLQRQVHVTTESGKVPAERVSQTTTVKDINLGRMTGGYDVDRCPGDEALQVVLEPRDCDGHTIKSPGSLKVGVMEVTPEGIKKPLSCWDVTPEQLRRAWKSGLMGSAYYIVLPWTNPPTTEKLRVVAQLTTEDGRTFEADKDVKIRLTVPPEHRPGNPVILPGTESAPVPHPVEGPSLSKASRTVQHQAARVDPANPWWQVKAPPVEPLSEAVHILRPTLPVEPIPVLGPPTSSPR